MNFYIVEKYRPQTIEDTILPQSLKDTFKEFVNQGEIPNLMLCGSAGVGKTQLRSHYVMKWVLTTSLSMVLMRVD